MVRARTRAACDKAAAETYRRVSMPDMTAFERFPKLTPEQQARSAREWEEL